MKVTFPEPIKSLIGRLEPRAVTNIYGGPGVGKTNLCILAMLDCVKKGGKVAYIDTESGFSLERLKQLSNDYENVLKAVEVLEPKSLKEQAEAISALKSKEVDLIIVDSMVALYRIEYSDVVENPRSVIDANRKLSAQLALLSTISRERNIPVLITSHSFKPFEDKGPDIVGGDVIKYWSKALVYLEKTGRSSERKAILIKHRSLPESGEARFFIVNEGVRPAE